MKRILKYPLLLAACALLTQGFAQEAITVMVQSGDTAYALARRAGISVDTLMHLNQLSSPELKIGQVLIVRQNKVHTVRAGDTLSGLALQYGVTLESLRQNNILPSDVITVGQVLQIPEGNFNAPVTARQPAKPVIKVEQPTSSYTLGTSWRDNAQALMGVPYQWGGSSTKGTDCSGFVLQVLAPLGVKLPRVSSDQARVGIPVELNQLQAGDLVFFDIEHRGKIDHVGIYMGNGLFANANSYKGQVALDKLSDQYWSTRYVAARRVLPDVIASS